MEELTFENNFKLMMSGLRWCCCRTLSVKNIYPCGVALVALYFTNYSLIFHDFNKDVKTDAYKSGFMSIVALNCFVKCIVLIYYRQNITDNINLVNADYKGMSLMTPEEKAIIRKNVKRALRVTQIWLFISFGTATIFPAKAIVLMCYYSFKGSFKYVQVFELVLPSFLRSTEPIPELVLYILFFIVECTFTCFAGTMYLGFEPLGPVFIVHACGQLEIAESKIMSLYSEPEEPEVLGEKLNQVIIILQNVYKYVQKTNTVFTAVYEINLKCATVGMPFCAIQIIEAAKNSQINLEFLLFFIGAVTLQFLPCYYSDLLKEKGESIQQAIYSCGWESNKDLKHRKTLIFMLARALKPPVICSVFCTLCLDTFADTCHSGYAIFNLVNASNA